MCPACRPRPRSRAAISQIMRASAILLVASCGGSEAPVIAPPLASHATAVAPRVPPDAAPADPPPPKFIDAFAARLRAGSVDLPSSATGPVILLDLDAQQLITLCGGAALAAAHDWGVDLADPKRMAARCMDGQDAEHFGCVQVRPDVLGVYFQTPGAPRLVGAMLGTIGGNKLTQTLANQFRTLMATASCP